MRRSSRDPPWAPPNASPLTLPLTLVPLQQTGTFALNKTAGARGWRVPAVFGLWWIFLFYEELFGLAVGVFDYVEAFLGLFYSFA